MIVHHCEQGSKEWHALRWGIPTASNFDRIITATGKPSKQSDEYRRYLLAERYFGHPLETVKTSWMERGSEMEGEACAFYEFSRDIAVAHVGIITNDAGTVGASPDGLVGDDGLVEFKCPSPENHIRYMLWSDVAKDYRVQLQGQLWIAERKWTDICSYHPAMEPVIVRVERDEEFIGLLAAEMAKFVERLEAEAEELIAQGRNMKTPVARRKEVEA